MSSADVRKTKQEAFFLFALNFTLMVLVPVLLGATELF